LRSYLLPLPFALFLVILPFPGTVAARLLLLLVAFLVSIWLYRTHHNDIPAIPGKTAIALWAAACLASILYAIDPAYSLGEVKNEVGYTMMAFFAFFVIANNHVHAKHILLSLLLGLLIIGGWGLIEWLHGGFRWNEAGGHGGSGVFATYLITVAPVVAYLAAVEQSQRKRLPMYGALLMLFTLAFATGQRAVWPALAAQSLVFWWVLSRRSNSGQLNPLVSLKSATIVLTIVATTSAGLMIGHAHRFGSEGEALSEDIRFRFWPTVIATIEENPMSGAGMGRRAFAKAYPERIPEENTLLWHAHNVLLNYGLSMGIPGVLVLAFLFGWWMYYFGRCIGGDGARALAGAAGLSIVLGVLVRNQFNDFFARDMSLLFWALVGLFARLAISTSDARKEAR